VIGIGTRWTDFTTASKTAFQDPNVRFININVAEFDAQKHAGLALVGDARAAIDALAGWSYTVEPSYREKAERLAREWSREVDRLYSLGHTPLPAQSEVIGAVNEAVGERDVVVCAAGSLPGDLHKLWRTRDPKGYHVEYGFSTMGYEIAGGVGVKMAAPDREVYVLVGDGSYLMMAQELVTAVQERIKIVVVVVDNHGHSSIGGLSRSLGSQGFGTQYRYRKSGSLGLDREGEQGDMLPVDLAANAASLGAVSEKVRTIAELRAALTEARRVERPYVVTIETDRYESVPSYESWWDVAPAEVSGLAEVRASRERYEKDRKTVRRHLRPPT
jgi:3D-(3,5/4)-trihydroxycyclohexane-1,2-dione acylhydrolase (decyclizing)